MTRSYDFSVETGATIRVEMEVGDGYNLLTDGANFAVQKNGNELLHGLFITNEGYEANLQVLFENPDRVDTLLAAPDDAPTLYVFQYDTDDGYETDFLFQVEGSGCACVLTSFAVYDEAKEAFDRVSIKVIQ